MVAEGVPNPRSTQPKQIRDEKETTAERNQVIWVVADRQTGIRVLICIPQQGPINETDLLSTREN